MNFSSKDQMKRIIEILRICQWLLPVINIDFNILIRIIHVDQF